MLVQHLHLIVMTFPQYGGIMTLQGQLRVAQHIVETFNKMVEKEVLAMDESYGHDEY